MTNYVNTNGNKTNMVLFKELSYEDAYKDVVDILGDTRSHISNRDLINLTYAYRKLANTKAFGKCDVWGNVI